MLAKIDEVELLPKLFEFNKSVTMQVFKKFVVNNPVLTSAMITKMNVNHAKFLLTVPKFRLLILEKVGKSKKIEEQNDIMFHYLITRQGNIVSDEEFKIALELFGTGKICVLDLIIEYILQNAKQMNANKKIGDKVYVTLQKLYKAKACEYEVTHLTRMLKLMHLISNKPFK